MVSHWVSRIYTLVYGMSHILDGIQLTQRRNLGCSSNVKSVSLAFMRICKMIFHSNKIQLLSHLMFFFSCVRLFVFFFKFPRCIVYLSKESLEYPEFVCFGQTPIWFLFLYQTLNSQTFLWTCEIMHSFGKKENMLWAQENTWSYWQEDSIDKESFMALWAKLPTRLKQVETNMIKQKAIIGQASSFHFGKSSLRLASP
jgi:hypothetical protein